MKKPPSNIAASVRARLLNISRGQTEDFQLVLTRYALERLLYRLSKSAHADRFVLKGAMLMLVWVEERYRPTRDLDLLGLGNASVDDMEAVFRDICEVVVEPDGLRFDQDSVSAEAIRDDEEYEGLRVTFMAYLENARIRVQVDIGFGDAITPKACELSYPSSLGFPSAEIMTYPPETVVAEKVEAVVTLGMANSRMKDYYDLYSLGMHFEFEGTVLVEAIQATFKRRGTPLPSNPPIGFTQEFAEDSQKQLQWTAFCRKSEISDVQRELPAMLKNLDSFILPPLLAAGEGCGFNKHWAASGPWTEMPGI